MSNHIEHIEITNFKSIRHQKIEGCKRINVFIGYPNVGKSAILEAMSALTYLQRDFNEDYYKLCRLKYSHELFYNSNVKNPATIQIDNVNTFVFKYLSEIDIEFSIKSSNGLAGGIERIIRSIHFRNGQISSVSSSYSTADKITPAIKKYIFSSNYNERKTSGLTLFSPFGENLVDVVHLNVDLRKIIIELFRRYELDFTIDPATNSIRGIKKSEDLPILIPYYQMADTLQRLIFHKAAIMSNENAVLLFEEPEAHMFPPYVSNFTGDIILDRNNNQYFISTHSPFVLNDLIEDAKDELSIYAVGLHNGETTIKRITEKEVDEIYQYGIDLFFNLEDYLKNV